MTHEFWGNRPPNAPDSPEWWALSEALLRLDGLGEDFELNTMEGWRAATEKMLDGLISVDEVTYAAQQRAFRSVGVETYEDVQRNMEGISIGLAAWLDGFVTAIAAIDRLKEIKKANNLKEIKEDN